MSYTLKDPVAIKEGHILSKCEICDSEILVTLREFKETWKDADESTRVSWFCKKCSVLISK